MGWSGWRRYAPAAGSVVAHVVVVGALISVMGIAGKPLPPPIIKPPEILTVTLVTDMLPPPPRVFAPVPPQRATSKDQKSAPIPPRKADTARPNVPSTATPPSGAATAATGVYLGPSQQTNTGAPLGLRTLLETDPCSTVLEKVRGDCAKKWAEIASTGHLLTTPSIEELQRLYPGFAPPRFGTCSKHMGCFSDYAGEWRSTNGTRAVGLKSPMASGPGGLGGANDMVGRLGPATPYQVDPGFGD